MTFINKGPPLPPEVAAELKAAMGYDKRTGGRLGLKVTREWFERMVTLEDEPPPEDTALSGRTGSECVQRRRGRRLEDRAQRLYEQNGADPHMLAALRKLVAMWEGDDWIVRQDEMAAIARAAISKAEGR